MDADQHVSDPQSLAWPLALGPYRGTGYHDVRTQPTTVDAKASDLGVSSHKQRQHIESLASIVSKQPRVSADCCGNGDADPSIHFR